MPVRECVKHILVIVIAVKRIFFFLLILFYLNSALQCCMRNVCFVLFHFFFFIFFINFCNILLFTHFRWFLGWSKCVNFSFLLTLNAYYGYRLKCHLSGCDLKLAKMNINNNNNNQKCIYKKHSTQFVRIRFDIRWMDLSTVSRSRFGYEISSWFDMFLCGFNFGMAASTIKMFTIIMRFCVAAAIFMVTIGILTTIMWMTFGFCGGRSILNSSV